MSRPLSIVLIIVATLLLLVANVGVWVETGILNEDSFVEITTDTFDADNVRTAIAERIVDTALADRPTILDLVGDRATSIIAEILGTSFVQGIVERAAGLIFDFLVYNDGNRVAINLEPIKDIIAQIVNLVAPEGSEVIQTDQIPDEIVILNEGEVPSIEPIITWTGWTAFIAGLLSVGLFALVLWRGWSTPNRNSYLKWIGGSVAIGAVIFLALTLGAKSTIVLIIDNSTGDVVISETYENLVRQLQAQSLILVVIGIAIWFVGWWAIRESRTASPAADQSDAYSARGQLSESEASAAS